MLLTGKMGSGKSFASFYLSNQHGAIRWSRTELMKRLAHAVANGAGSIDEILEKLFENQDERDHARENLLSYIITYEDEPGKPRTLYQEITDICQEIDPYCFERELSQRIENAGSEASFSLVDDVRIVPAFNYFKELGYVTVRITAPDEVCRARMLRRDGYLPDEKAFSHSSETQLDNVPHQYVIDNGGDDVSEFYGKLDDLISEICN